MARPQNRMHTSCDLTSYAHRSKWSFWAKSCQSLPLALAVSKVAQILWRMDKGILKALGPVWDVMVQSVCIKNGTDSFSVWRNRAESDWNQTLGQIGFANVALCSLREPDGWLQGQDNADRCVLHFKTSVLRV